MIYGSLQINRRVNFYNVKKVCIVTSAHHMRRSLELAKVFLPRTVEVVGFAATELCGKWRSDPDEYDFVAREVPLLKSLVDNGMIGDIEF